MPTMDAAELLARADAARLAGDVTGVRAALVAAFEAARSAGDSRLMAAAALAMPTSQGFGVHAGQLRALDVLAGETGSARAAFFATSRRATLALAGGDLAAAGPLISHLAVIAAELAEPDTEAVMHSLHGMRALVADDLAALREEAAAFEAYGRSEGIPSVCAEAAVLWLAAGQPDRAGQLVAVLTAGGVAAVAHDVDFL